MAGGCARNGRQPRQRGGQLKHSKRAGVLAGKVGSKVKPQAASDFYSRGILSGEPRVSTEDDGRQRRKGTTETTDWQTDQTVGNAVILVAIPNNKQKEYS